jgi:hypothetical protein
MSRIPLAAVFALAACNSPPEGLEIRLEPESPDTTRRLVAAVRTPAVDPQQDPVTLRYAWAVDGEPTPLTGPVVEPEFTTRGETWEVTVTPSDGELAGTPAIAAVTIQNSLPTTIVRVPDREVTSDQAFGALVDVGDADGDPVEVTWSWTRNGVPSSVTGPDVSADLTERGDVWAPSVTLSDGVDTTAPIAGDEVQVGNTAPRLDSARLTPDVPVEASIVGCEAGGWTDDDGDPQQVRVAWSINGIPQAEDLGETIDGTRFSRGDTLQCTVTPFDGFSDGVAVESPPVQVQNTPPTLVQATVEPGMPTAADTLRVGVDGIADDDDDPVRVEVAWLVDGELAGTGDTFSGLVRGQTVVARVTPWDGREPGVDVESAPVLVQNDPPSITSIIAGPAGASVEDVARATSIVADLDGDEVSVRYAWSRGGVAAGTGETMLLSTFKRGDSLTVTATPNDGTTDGAPVPSAPLVVGNAKPTITGITFSPSLPRPSETVRAVVTTNDADRDAVTLTDEWTVGTKVITGKTALVGGTDFKADDKITLKVTPNDGLDDGPPRTASTTALGTRPTPPRAQVVPALPKAGDTLQCVVDEPSIDPDGGTVTYVVSWSLIHPTSGHTWVRSTTTWTNDTISGAYIKQGHLWECSINAFDGVEYSPSDRSYATVSDGVERRVEDADIRLWGVGVGTVVPMGDLDSDGVNDFGFGSPSASQVVLYSGDWSGDADAADADLVTLSGVGRFDRAGQDLLANVDFDEDGDLDLIVSAPDGGSYGEIYLIPAPFKTGALDKLATATLAGPSTGPFNFGKDLASADFDGDDDVELLTADAGATVSSLRSAGEIYVLEGPFSGSLSLGSADTVIQGTAASATVGNTFAVGDTNGDGDDDLVTVNKVSFSWSGTTGGMRWDLFEGPLATGTLSATADMDHTIYAADGTGYAGGGVTVADIDADGYDDLLLIHELAAKVERRVHLLDGNLSTAALSTTSARSTFTDLGRLFPARAEIGDVDGSGDADLIVSEVSDDLGGNIRIYLDPGTGAYDSDDATDLLGGAWYNDRLAASGFEIYDVDADGLDDIVTQANNDDLRENRVFGSGLIAVFYGAGL